MAKRPKIIKKASEAQVKDAYARLLKLKGKLDLKIDLEEFRKDKNHYEKAE
jgi:hypothetical protein